MSLSPETIKVGDGVTYAIGSDRVAGTIVSVSASGKTVGFTLDDYRATPDSNYYGNQEYTYTSVPASESVDPMGNVSTNVSTARWNEKKGRFVYFGAGLSAGRRVYRDPSF